MKSPWNGLTAPGAQLPPLPPRCPHRTAAFSAAVFRAAGAAAAAGPGAAAAGRHAAAAAGAARERRAHRAAEDGEMEGLKPENPWKWMV